MTLCSRNELPESAGFLDRISGAALGRSTMIPDLTTLLATCGPDAALRDYRLAVVDDNLLGKPSQDARHRTLRALRDRYLLDPGEPMFRALRLARIADPSVGPLLGMLLACARDPLLRRAATVILPMPLGTPYNHEALRPALVEAAGGRVQPASIDAILSRQSTCWFQSGHLRPATASSGPTRRVRGRAVCRPAAVAYALWLGHLEGLGGDALFASRWVPLLDVSRAELDEQAAEAGRQGLIDLRRGGGVTSVGFRYLTGNQVATGSRVGGKAEHD